jgi:hypothetical protein
MMSREIYINHDFRGDTRLVVDHAKAILSQYHAMGFRMTLRQLYYQFVAKGLVENRDANYRRMSRIISQARDAGEIDWDMMEDRSRQVVNHACWSDPSQFLTDVVQQYAEDLWHGQQFRPEVWVEKDAVIGVIEGACERWRVPYFATHGDTGQLHVREAGLRFAEQHGLGLTPVVFHLADHDPSGIKMTRDVTSRLQQYAGYPVKVKRVLLNIGQVRRYRLPPNFTKESDPNTGNYHSQFGTDECWELDALAPDVIARILDNEIEKLVDQKKWAAAERKERRNKKSLHIRATPVL